MVEHVRGLVVGGGIGGLSTALALRQAGIDATVYERHPDVRTAGAAITVWPFVYPLFRRLGIMDAISAEGGELRHSELRNWDGTPAPGLTMGGAKDVDPDGVRGYPLCIMRHALHTILLDALGREHLVLDARLSGLDVEATGTVRAAFGDGRVAEGDFLVGADGVNSTARSLMFPGSDPAYDGQVLWRSVVRPDDGAFDGTGFVAFGRGERFGAEPAGNGLVYWFAAKFLPEHAPEPTEGRRQWLHEQFRHWAAPIPALIAATPEEDILRHDVYTVGPLPAWGTGPLTLLGDAAHAVPPHTGQGACMAVEDAVALADHLAEAPDVIDGLRCYEHDRMDQMRSLHQDAMTQRSELSESGPREMREALAVRDREA